MIKFFDLAARDTRLRFSPYCWRTKMALKHKGLAFETKPWRFTDKEAIAYSGQGRVPVLIFDDGKWLNESWDIALNLDRRYPDRPMLMASEAERAAARLVNTWCDLTLHLTFRPLLLLDVYKNAAEKDQRYFRESREKLVGMTLEELSSDRANAVQALVNTFAPFERTLKDEKFLGGAAPNYADYALFGSLQWANCISGTHFLPPDFAGAAWFERLLDLHDGYARKAPTVRDLAAA
jgi:glutathione S-transferase